VTANTDTDAVAQSGTIDTLRERDDVPVVETERTAPPEAFEGMAANYEACEGTVDVGVVDDGRLLLVDHGAPGPVGGDVEPGEHWATAARRRVEELTGVAVAVETPVRVECTTFVHPETDEQFTVPTVEVLATLAGDDLEAFREDPQVLADPDHKYHDDGTDLDLGWHDAVPDDVHPNHEDQVRRFLEVADT
jgi:ADP-ribose pyrophosphatase YjhB (NUDIX family)